MAEFCISGAELRKALVEIEEGEAAGLNHCLAVFRVASAGRMISDNLMEYSDLIERGHPTDERQDWGRFQGVRHSQRLVNGRLVPTPATGGKDHE